MNPMNVNQSEAGEALEVNTYNTIIDHNIESYLKEEDPDVKSVMHNLLCQDCMTQVSPFYYSCTFNIHPDCRISRRKWSSYSSEQQTRQMESLFYSFINEADLYVDGDHIRYEKTKAGNIHMHCMIFTFDEDIDPQQTLNSKLRFGRYESFICSQLVTEEDEERWCKYVHKEDKNI